MANRPIVYGKTDLPEDQVMSLDYKMSGRTAAQFHSSDTKVRCCVGNVGGGKSAMCVWELLFRSIRQKANSRGIRESKWAIIRNTYPDLLNTTLRDFTSWLPPKQYPHIGYSLTINYSKPIIARLSLKLPKGFSLGFCPVSGTERETIVEAEFVFLALDLDDDIAKLRGLSLTGAWINESCQISKSIFEVVEERIGRFPHMKDGGFDWCGIIMDTNPPDIDHWIPELFEKECPPGYQIFHQPPAILDVKDAEGKVIGYAPNTGQDPNYPPAENVHNLQEGYNYWLSKTHGRTRAYIQTMLQGKYGTIMSGKPIYSEYSDEIHRAKSEKDVPLYRGIPLLCSLDYGNTPSACFTQLTPRGKLVVLDEICCGLSESQLKDKPKDRYFGDMGIRNFALNVLKPYIKNNYGDVQIVYTGDPAGGQRSQTTEQSCIDELRDCGFIVGQASTNLFLPRKEAVEGYMLKRDGFLVSPRCIWLLEGFQKYYRYKSIKKPNGVAYASEPDKQNPHSHIQDALQYACLYFQGTSGKPNIPGSVGYGSNARREVQSSGYGGYA